MATIYVIRHGQASFGSDDYDNLSELGRLQASRLGEYLRDSDVHLDAAYCGQLRRQRDTAELALAAQPGKVPLRVDRRLDEVRNDEQIELLLPRLLDGDPELQAVVDRGLSSSKDYQKVIAAVFKHWVSPQCDAAGIQSWQDYASGVQSALRDVMLAQGKGKSIAMFTSGGTIATLVARVLGVPDHDVYQFYEPVFNCSITQLFYSGDRVSLSGFNDCSYLRVLGQQRGESLVTYR
ncbi:MAG: histidine phosphatase family protein [Pseudomonadales bacterium]